MTDNQTPLKKSGKKTSSIPSPDAEDPQKYAVLEIITEFIESGDINEAMDDIKRRVSIEGTEFVKRALIFGIERKAYERELISQLLSAVYEIFMKEIPDGFQLVLDRLPDMVLDVPDATEVLGKFLSRAVYDEILPPIFLKDAKAKNSHAQSALSMATLTCDSDDRRRLEHIWGPGSLTSVTRLRDEVDILLKEYLEIHNTNIAALAVRDLNAPSFNSQVLKQALILALEKNTESDRDAIMNLFSYFLSISLVSKRDIEHSFNLLWRRVPDIKLDVPNAEQMLTTLTTKAKERKLLQQNFSPDSVATQTTKTK